MSAIAEPDWRGSEMMAVYRIEKFGQWYFLRQEGLDARGHFTSESEAQEYADRIGLQIEQ